MTISIYITDRAYYARTLEAAIAYYVANGGKITQLASGRAKHAYRGNICR